ncbi:hypothetical protein [Dactylosporangium sp. CA-233914]|uniref:hypothetical protein n=1 Tax=Dactylosporangium sp. CA-233914 TaxID=3239934 RepID=UPI003D8BA6F1
MRTYGVDAQARGWVAGAMVAFEPTPELVHGVAVADPVWAARLRNAGTCSGKRIRPGYADALAEDVPADVVISDLPS